MASSLVLLLLGLFAHAHAAIIEARVTYANSTVSSTSRPTSSSALTTNTTSSTSTFSNTKTDGTCCYIVNNGVGVNTWYTNTAKITVATVVTEWTQYDDTIIAGNVSTVYDATATAIYGVYAQGGSVHAYTTLSTQVGFYTSMGFVPQTSGTSTYSSYAPLTTVPTTRTNVGLYTTVSWPTDIPTTLLDQDQNLYQEQWVGTETAMTFPEQDLTVYSPTPYFLYPRIGILTSASCNSLTTATSYHEWTSITINGTRTYGSTIIPTTTFTTGAPFFANAFSYDVTISQTIVQPFPSGSYTDWNYTDFIADNGVTTEGGGENVFYLPENLPNFLAEIPSVLSAYPDIGSCTVGIGQGEPTVHVPVNALTTDMHITSTISGNYDKAAGSASTTTAVDSLTSPKAHSTASDLVPPTTAAADQQGTDSSASTSPAGGTGGGQGGATATPDVSPAGAGGSSAAGTPSDETGSTAGGSAGQAPGTSGGQQDSPSSTGGNGTPQANAPNTAAQSTAAGPTDQGTTNAAISSDIAFTYVPPDSTSPAALSFGTNVATRNSASDFVFGSTTLSAGGAAGTFDGTTVSIVSGGQSAVFNGQTSAIAAGEASSTPALVVSGTTLVAGGPAGTFGGTTIALASGGTGLIVNGNKSPLAAATSVALMVGSTVVATPDASGGYVLPGGQTLSSGGLLVESGTIYAAGPSGGLIVNGQSATPLPSAEQTGGGVAGAIMSMFGMGGSQQSTSTAGPGTSSGSSTSSGPAPAAYTGGAAALNTMTKTTASAVTALLALVCYL